MRQLIKSEAPSIDYAAIAAVLFAAMLLSVDGLAASTGCSAAANASRLACDFAAKDDLFTARAICMDSPDDDLVACIDEVQQEFDDVLEECDAIFEAQAEVCEITDDAAHLPEFGGDFPRVLQNEHP